VRVPEASLSSRRARALASQFSFLPTTKRPNIAATVAALRADLTETDRLLVVADNCRDGTAQAAAAAGAEIVERHDPSRHGKGYALAFGVEHLSKPPA
jgi:glycosyltransferase involved in cell wall biosynthesis